MTRSPAWSSSDLSDRGGRPWYLELFGSSFWALAEDGHPPERTDREIAYLAETIGGVAPGRRILDLGCEPGRRAVGLARRGFEVVGVDASPQTIERARAAAGGAGGATFAVCDLLAAEPWPLGTFDAVILVGGLGWGGDADQQRLLRRARRHLVLGGALVLEVSSATAILQAFAAAHAEARSAHDRFTLRRSYDVGTGRVLGVLEQETGDGQRRARHPVRLYLLEEVLALLRRVGFDVVGVDADHVAGARPALDTRYAQVVAQARAVPPASLAVETRTRAGGGGRLDLHWTPDEAEFLDPPLEQVWSHWLPASAEEQVALAASYALNDPYGGRDAAPVLSILFDAPLDPVAVTFGAGATHLLACLARLAHSGTIAASPFVHPDLPAWARTHGAHVTTVDGADVSALRVAAPTLLVLERPDPRGACMPAAQLAERCRAVSDLGTVVVVDESFANYLGPRTSATAVTVEVPNLVVVRSLSKGYCMGGLRVGYTVASPLLAADVREVVPPLSAAALPYGFALQLLRAGDMFARLRRRIAEIAPEVRDLLARLGVRTAACHPGLPWLVAREPERAAERLDEHEISYKRIDPMDGQGAPLVRLGIPLSDARVQALRKVVNGG